MSLTHVKAHNDQPWNELVDSLAKAAATSAYKPAAFSSSLLSVLVYSPYHAWLAITQSAQDLEAYPPYIDGEFHATSIPTHTSSIHNYNALPPPPASGHTNTSCNVVLRSATHNVMSAVDEPADTTIAFDSANISILSQQYAHHFLHIIGQQESRLPAKKKLSSLYSIISSGTTAGYGLGCSIWVARFLPYFQCGGKSYMLSMQHLFTIHASPRLLVVDVDAHFLRIRLISAHAPQAKHIQARVTFFSLLGRYVVHPYPLLFFDSNS